MKLLLKIFIGFILLCVYGITLVYASGSDKTKRAEPERVVSLGQSLTEALYSLGVENKVVGVTIHCNKPLRAKEKEKVGNSVAIDVEKILSLNPDLVLATPLTDIKSVTKLRQLGIKVILFRAPKNFDELCDQYLEIAKLFGKEEAAKITLAKARSKLNKVRASLEGLNRPRVVVQIGADPLWFAPQESFINDFIDFARGDNIIPGKMGNYGREKILEQNPEIIIVTTMGLAGFEEKKQWEKFTQLSAVKNGRIYVFDSDKLCSAVPDSFVETLYEIVKVLHPDYE